MMARKFLVAVAVIATLVLAGAIVWRLTSDRLLQFALRPSVPFEQSVLAEAPDYADRASWVARPDMAGNPATWAPQGYRPAPRAAAAAFFVPPTAWLGRGRWNAPLDDPDTNDRLDLFTRMQATTLNGVADIWAPRYRQMSLGGFLSRQPDSERALAVAFGDVERAFEAFLAAQPADRPLILAGHSQGALHLMRLIARHRDRLEGRLVAAYVIGWPVALPGDLEAMGLPACTSPEQAGCIMAWQSWAHDGERARALAQFEAVPDLVGAPIGGREMLCTNPLTGGDGQSAGPERNLGTLMGDRLEPRRAGARCDPKGLLLIEPVPRDIGPFVLPGGNFHAYDIPLFWGNMRADVEARLSALAERTFGGTEPGPGTA